MNKSIDKIFWDQNGYLVLNDLLNLDELNYLTVQVDVFLQDKENSLRTDLSGETNQSGSEKITQIMRPSLTDPSILESKLYQKTLQVAKTLLGDDVAVDFDMIINKLPHTNTPTPWHQDAAYWLQMADKRACSFWIALDDVDEENGCMMYVPKSHKQALRKHEQINGKGALQVKVPADEYRYLGVLSNGSAIVHHGHTLHGALGNTSNRNRRAWIINFRPQSMIDFLRDNNYDHTGERKNKSA